MRKRRKSICATLMCVIAVLYLIFENNQLYNDRLYLFSAKNEFRLHGSDKSATFVLLMGYSNYTVSWSRDILSYAVESFYVSEPLKMLLVDGYYKKDLVCYNNNTCRRPRSQTEKYVFAMMTLHKIYTCQFSTLCPIFSDIIVKTILEMYAERVVFKHCTNGISQKSAECIEELEKFCRSKTHRIILATKLSIEIVNEMLELWSNLKVVHIVQDPLSVIHSHLNGEAFTTGYNVARYSSNLCARMYDDLQYGRRLERKYPSRLKLVPLEALTGSPFSATGVLYEFLDMFLYTEKVWFWVYTNIQNMVKKDFYKTYRFNLTRDGSHLKAYMSFRTVGVIEQYCRGLYYTLGYVAVNSTNELRSKEVSFTVTKNKY